MAVNPSNLEAKRSSFQPLGLLRPPKHLRRRAFLMSVLTVEDLHSFAKISAMISTLNSLVSGVLQVPTHDLFRIRVRYQ